LTIEQLLKRFIGVCEKNQFFIHNSVLISIQICSLLSNISSKSVPLLLKQTNFLDFLSSCLIETNTNSYSTGLRAESSRLCGTLFSSLDALKYFERKENNSSCEKFINNTPKILIWNLANDQNMNVRMRSCWALSNLCETIVERINDEKNSTTTTNAISIQSKFLNENSFELFLKTVSRDHEKVKVLAIRLLGQIVSLIDLKINSVSSSSSNQKEFLSSIPLFSNRSWNSILISISDVLKSNLSKGSAKVKWNICHAFSNILKCCCQNQVPNKDFLREILDCLTQLIRTNDNLKVKINATIAILSISERSHFSNQLVGLEELMLIELEKCENISIFSQLKYKESLLQKVCLK